MLATAIVDKDGRASGDQIESLLLTCALIRSRQHMADEIKFPAQIKDAAGFRTLDIELEIHEEISIDTLSCKIGDLTKNPKQLSECNTRIDDDEQCIKITRSNEHWEIRGLFPDCHATSFDQTFNHVYQQIRRSSSPTRPSQIETVRKGDIEWFLKHSVKDIPPPNPVDGATLFQQCAAQWSNRVAIDAWDGQLTYKELEEESDRLAEALIRQCVQPRTILPLVFEFSKSTLIALLATWKAGAAFVFLDPSHPASRLQTLVNQVHASVVLAQKDWPELHLGPNVRILILEDILAQARPAEVRNTSMLPPIDPIAPAYIIFTSGSTGQPKAALHTHLAFSSGALHQANLLGFSSHTRTLENAPLIFAGAIPELLFTVLKGGCLCIPRQEDRLKDLAGCVRHFQSNMLVISSSSAAIHDPAQFKPRQRLLMGGEPLPSHTANRWAALHDNCNGYGSTETNTVATCCPISTAVASQSVGPGAAHQYWVVDALDYDRLMPPGWLGEVVVEGHALASEYLGNQEATDKSFPSPPKWHSNVFRDQPKSTRFFRTGDLGRIALDGTLEVHGRTDPLQVKLRGQRIELGEVEAVTIKALPQTCPVVAELILPAAQNRPSIALFFVATGYIERLQKEFFAETLSLSTVQDNQFSRMKDLLTKRWQASLPAFMRPTYLIPLAQLPRTPTGKLDRRRLRQWASKYHPFEVSAFSTSKMDSQVSRAFATDTEIRLGEAVSKVVAVPLQLLNGNSTFTGLGGDSLSAIELAQDLRDHGVFVSPADIIRSESLSWLAAYIDHEKDSTSKIVRGSVESCIDTLEKDDILQSLKLCADQIQDVLPTTNFQSRAIELGSGPERSLVYHFVLKFSGNVNNLQLMASLQKLVNRHDALRTLFTKQDGHVVQIVLNHVQCPMESSNVKDESSLHDFVKQITTSNFGIDQVPTKFWILSVNDVPKRLVLRLSHAQFDGLSIPILWDSLAQCYASTEELPPASEYSKYVREILGKDSTHSKAYFTHLLHDVPFTDLIKRPTKDHRPHNCHLQRRMTVKPIPGFTPATLFEAAWGYVSARSSRSRAVVFDQVVSGRQVNPHANIAVRHLVGACLNDVPVVVRFPSGQTLRQLMEQIRDQHAATARHETLGFGEILSQCTPRDWPRDARIFSSVQYLGFEEKSTFRIGEAECVASMVERSMDLEDLTVLVTLLRGHGSGAFDVEFLFSDQVVSHAQADEWFEEFVCVVDAFTRDEAFEEEVESLLGPIDAQTEEFRS